MAAKIPDDATVEIRLVKRSEIKTQYQYIGFVPFAQKTKTSVWSCINNRSGATLGYVKWYGSWRQYCFFPYPDTVFNISCMNDIEDFIKQLMELRKGA